MIHSSANELLILPSKAIYSSGEEISGQLILNLKESLPRSGVLVLSIEGKEYFEYLPYSSKSN